MSSASSRALSRLAARALAKRAVLPLNPTASIAIKRNVHEFWVEAPADAFADAFRTVLEQPGARFGPLAIRRLKDNVGRPFSMGERFQAGFVLDALLAGRGPSWLQRLAASEPMTWVEELALSDFAEVCLVTPRRVGYRYLQGSPIAGHSTFEVTPNGPEACHFAATFVFQEVAGWAVEVMHRFAASQHDAVTVEQVARAARALGASARTTCRQGLDLLGDGPTLRAAA